MLIFHKNSCSKCTGI